VTTAIADRHVVADRALVCRCVPDLHLFFYLRSTFSPLKRIVLHVADLFTDDRVRTLSQQVSTLGDRVWEMEHKITQLIGEKARLEKQLEETKAISSHKEEVERSLKAENDKLRSEVSIAEEKCSKSEAEVEMLKKGLLALAEAKEAAAKEFSDERARIILESEDLRRRLEKIQAIKDLAESENDKLRSEALIAEEKRNMFEAEIERLKMELGGLAEAKEAAAKAFDAQNAETTEELEELKRKLEETQTTKDLVEGENDKLQSEVFAAEEKCRQSEAEVKCLKQIVGAVVEVKEAAAKAAEAEKVEIMKEMDNLKKDDRGNPGQQGFGGVSKSGASVEDFSCRAGT
jgi:chromosome segregation ATPase